MNPYPKPEIIDEIATREAPILRNLQITQSYFELSMAMTERLGTSANWCTFATWASKQAGQTIRKEDLRRAMEQLLTPPIDRAVDALDEKTQQPEKKIRERLWEVLNPAQVMNHASDAVARGNQKVFAEIGHEFSRFLEICGSDTTFQTENIDRFCNALKSGDPPDGQQYLQHAFLQYYHAFFESDAKVRAELILLANIEIGFHEQTRLQPEIAEALDASVPEPAELMPKLLDALFPYRGWIIYLAFSVLRAFGFAASLDTKLQQFIRTARREIRELLTKYVMTLGFPEGHFLHLGKNVAASFPANLQQITNGELLKLLQKVDPTANSTEESGAIDWADLPDRLHFIVDLFRCHQETADLLSPPFSPEQTSAIKTGSVPDGDL